MSQIKRYEPVESWADAEGPGKTRFDPVGRFVLYEAHRAELERVERERDKAHNSMVHWALARVSGAPGDTAAVERHDARFAETILREQLEQAQARASRLERALCDAKAMLEVLDNLVPFQGDKAAEQFNRTMQAIDEALKSAAQEPR